MKFNNYLDAVREVENTYVPPKFDKKLYESLKNRIDISRKIISIIVINSNERRFYEISTDTQKQIQ